jgi:uncharacterized protein
MNDKYTKLTDYIKQLSSVIIAFSGGVDSTLLAKAAFDALGDKALAVTAVSRSYPEKEREEAARFASQIGIRHDFIESDELAIEEFVIRRTDATIVRRPCLVSLRIWRTGRA